MVELILGALAAVIAGGLAGAAITAAAASFTWDGGLQPWPRCGACGKTPAGSAAVPLIGCLRWRRCKTCQASQPWRTSLLAQLLTIAVFVLLYLQLGVSVRLPVSMMEAAVLLAVALIDWQHRLIPTLLVYPTVLFAIATSPAWPSIGVVNSLIGGAIGFALFLVLALLARVTFGVGALGAGDVTLAALIGAICGYPLLILALAVGALCGGVGALAALATRRSTIGSTIPYGPFLVAGVLYVMVNGYALHPLFSVP